MSYAVIVHWTHWSRGVAVRTGSREDAQFADREDAQEHANRLRPRLTGGRGLTARVSVEEV